MKLNKYYVVSDNPFDIVGREEGHNFVPIQIETAHIIK